MRRWPRHIVALASIPFLSLLLFFILSLFSGEHLSDYYPIGYVPSLNLIDNVTASTGGTPPLSIFVGIITLPDSDQRRNFLRALYHTQMSHQLPSTVVVDINFVFCNLNKPEHHVFVSLEIARYGDIIILNCTEDMNSGKTYTYFSSLPRILHRRYDYVMKADDDTYLRLPRLASSLRSVSRRDLYYGYLIPCGRQNPEERGTYMSGMALGISWDLVEWISTSEIPEKNKVGPEDMMIGKWFDEGNRAKNRVSEKPGMYNFPGSDVEKCAHELIPETVAVHRVKRWDQWRDVLVYFNVTVGIVKPSKLIHS